MQRSWIIALGLLLSAQVFAADSGPREEPAEVRPASQQGDDQLDEDLNKARQNLKEMEEMLRRARVRLEAQRQQAPDTEEAPKHDEPKIEENPLPDIPAPDAPVKDEKEFGLLLLDMGRLDEALPHLLAASREALNSTDQAWMLFSAATCHRKLGRINEAIALYEEVATSFGDTLWAQKAAWLAKSMEWFERWNNSFPVQATTTAQQTKEE